MIDARTAATPRTRLAAGIAAALALAAGSQPALADNWPVYVSGSQRITHDSNVFRATTEEQSDVISTTSATIGLDKNYGRQNYQASLSVNANRYSENDQLDYNGYQGNLGFSSTIGQDISVSAAFNKERALASFAANTDRRVERNIRDSQSYGFNGRYGLYGAMSVGVSASHFEQDYTARSGSYPEQSSSSYGFDVRYTPRQLLTFGVGYRHSPGRSSYSNTDTNGSEFESSTNNIDFTTAWQVSGLSVLDARFSLTRQERKAVGDNSGLQLVNDDYQGWTGQLNWRYTPRGRLSYRVAMARDTTNNSSLYDTDKEIRPVYSNTISSSDNRVSTTFNANVDWEATAKVRVGLGTQYGIYETRRLQEQTQTILGNTTTEIVPVTKNGRFVSVGLSANYDALRWLSMGCNVSKERRTEDLDSTGYHATVFGCVLTATLNAQN